jgi:hypothetical protein
VTGWMAFHFHRATSCISVSHCCIRPNNRSRVARSGRGATSRARPWARIAAQQDRRAALIGRTEAS